MVCKTPLKWPAGTPRSKSRKEARFGHKSSSGYGSRQLTVTMALDRLMPELHRLGVTDMDAQVVISTNMKVGISGMILSAQGEPADPGVVVHWEARGKQRTMSVDIYDRVADNIAAIAAVLGYLRGVERHGGAIVQDQAFAGFDALPPPDDCWKILGIEKGSASIKRPDVAKQYVMDAFRIAAREGHGNGVDMDRIVKARNEALKQLGVT
jgi:hypothetical protein